MSKEDIEILNRFTENDYTSEIGWSGYYDSELKELQQAVQNILKENEANKKRIEELEVENKVLKKANNISENITIKDITNFMNKSLEDFNKEYIPVFLVEEKIEEIDQENLGYSENEWYLESEVKEYATEKLQELLKDGGE